MKFRLNKVWAVMLAAFMLCSLPAQAVDNGAFELDGNAADASPGASPTDDWQNIANNTDTAFKDTGIVSDSSDNDDDIFTGGGTKDDNDLSQWKYKSGKPKPDKNNITNAYAAAYSNVSNDLIIYFGADRFAEAGDAQLGFWFFKSTVKADPNGDGFTNPHTPGDILVLANFAGNNSVSVEAFAWDPGNGTDGTNNLRKIGSGGLCDGTGTQLACAIPNTGGQQAFWPYTPKAGAAGFFPQNSFFEGGINVTQLLQGSSSCFSSFLAETRSSTSTDAVLKDFRTGGFDVCGISASQNCGATVLANDPDWLFSTAVSVTVKNNGALAFPENTTIGVTITTVNDSSITQPAVFTVGAGGMAPGATQVFNATILSDDNPPEFHASVLASLPDGTKLALTEDDVIFAQCTKVTLNPDLFVDKTCETSLSDEGSFIALKVDYSIDVCNTGDVPLTLSINDPTAGVSQSGVKLDYGMNCNQDSDCDSVPDAEDGFCDGLSDGNSGVCRDSGINNGDVCKNVSGHYLPADINSLVPGNAIPSNKVTVSGVDVEGTAVDGMATAYCPLCPVPTQP